MAAEIFEIVTTGKEERETTKFYNMRKFL